MELFTADGHDAGGCERVTGKSGMRPVRSALTNPVRDGLNDSQVVLVDAASVLVLRDKRAAGVASGGQWIAGQPSG